GAVIAPRVVLTAGHCVAGDEKGTVFKVLAPYANGQTAKSKMDDYVTMDWTEDDSSTVSAAHHDVALIFLETPIMLDQYPTLAQSKLDDGAAVTVIGRLQDGVESDSEMFMRPNQIVYDGAVTPPTLDDGVNFRAMPLDYVCTTMVLQHGDSGGP